MAKIAQCYPEGKTCSAGHQAWRSQCPQIAGLHSRLWRWCGNKDLTVLPRVPDFVWLQMLAGVGTDLGKSWRSEKHFTAWLGVAPDSPQSGKRRRSQKRGCNPGWTFFLRDLA